MSRQESLSHLMSTRLKDSRKLPTAWSTLLYSSPLASPFGLGIPKYRYFGKARPGREDAGELSKARDRQLFFQMYNCVLCSVLSAAFHSFMLPLSCVFRTLSHCTGSASGENYQVTPLPFGDSVVPSLGASPQSWGISLSLS